MKKYLNILWRIFLHFSTAIGLLNLVDDISPSLINFSFLIEIFLDGFVWIRDIILKPLTYPLLMIFDFNLPDWLRTYIFLGAISWNAYNMAYLKICGFFSYSSPIDFFFTLIFAKEPFVSKIKRFLLSISIELFLWPYQFILLIWFHVKKEHKQKTYNVYTEWGKYLMIAMKLVLLILIINFFILKL